MLLKKIEIAGEVEDKVNAARSEYVPRIADRMQGGEGRPLSTEQLGGLSDELRAALEKAQKSKDHATAVEALAPYIPKTTPALVDLGLAAQDPQPEQLIGYGKGSLLAAGEVLVLAGRGGAGKSTLACQLALAAATGPTGGETSTAGLTVATGGVVLLSFEDRRWRVWNRVQRIAQAQGIDRERLDQAMQHIGVCEAAGFPLFGVEDGGHISQAPKSLAVWKPLWGCIAAREPRLVVIDPALAAFNGDDARVSAVRAFMDALRQELEALGAGLILVAHSTKAAQGIDPGAVSGSAAWTDAARAALLLKHEGEDGSGDMWTLKSIKSNYSAPVDLSLHAQGGLDGAGGLCGFELVEPATQTTAASANGDGYDLI